MHLSASLEAYPPHRRGAAVPFAVWLALSIVLHGALMFWLPQLRMSPSAEPELPPMTVLLQPRSSAQQAPPPPPPVVAPRPQPQRPPQPRPPQRQRAAKTPPVIALDKPKPDEPVATVPTPKMEPPAPPVAATPPAPPAPTAPPVEKDLAAYIEARRRARGEAPSEAALEAERANRGAFSSPGLNQATPSAINPERARNGYGSFEIRRRGVDYAEYMFRGWNANFRRDGLELIEVRQGNASSIDLAVIRSIIEIIRRSEGGDFTWQSRRLGRTLTLSARTRDNSGLEEFMMQEFYDDLHRYR